MTFLQYHGAWCMVREFTNDFFAVSWCMVREFTNDFFAVSWCMVHGEGVHK